jgi:RNA-directed DNA polymerase
VNRISFLTSRAPSGHELFEKDQRGFLKRATGLLKCWIISKLSNHCWHTMRGAKQMLCAVHNFLRPNDFVFKTDVRNYYSSINHSLLFHCCVNIGIRGFLLDVIVAYMERTQLYANGSHQHTIGIPKGGSLSPLLGALYLNACDKRMELWVKRGDVFYARFMDDIILIARTRSVFRRAKQALLDELEKVELILRPEKTMLGRAFKGFDLLGYQFMYTNSVFKLSPSQKTIQNALDNGKQCYARKGPIALATYQERWNIWLHAGIAKILLSSPAITFPRVLLLNDPIRAIFTNPSKKLIPF